MRKKNGQNDLKVSSSFHQSRSKLSFLSLLLYHKIKSHQIRYRNKKVKLYFIHKLHLFLSDTIMIWNLNVFSEIHFDIVKRNFWRFSFWTIAISGNGRKVSFDIYCRFSGFPLGSDKIVILRFLIVLEEEEEEKGRYIGGGGLLEIITTSAGTERIISCKLQLLLIVWRYYLVD